jgi:hypothetical protein
VGRGKMAAQRKRRPGWEWRDALDRKEVWARIKKIFENIRL